MLNKKINTKINTFQPLRPETLIKPLYDKKLYLQFLLLCEAFKILEKNLALFQKASERGLKMFEVGFYLLSAPWMKRVK